MTTKPALAFQPAPRPRSRVSAEDSQRLQEATRDLGFGRASSAPAIEIEAPVQERPKPAAAPKLKPLAAKSKAPELAPPKRAPALKFDVPDEVWDDLRMAALKRRVTVKFLVLEALAAKGYAIDLDAIPEDGRRLR